MGSGQWATSEGKGDGRRAMRDARRAMGSAMCDGHGQWAISDGQCSTGNGQDNVRRAMGGTLQAGWVSAQLHSSINQLHAALICNDRHCLQEFLHACIYSLSLSCTAHIAGVCLVMWGCLACCKLQSGVGKQERPKKALLHARTSPPPPRPPLP